MAQSAAPELTCASSREYVCTSSGLIVPAATQKQVQLYGFALKLYMPARIRRGRVLYPGSLPDPSAWLNSSRW